MGFARTDSAVPGCSIAATRRGDRRLVTRLRVGMINNASRRYYRNMAMNVIRDGDPDDSTAGRYADLFQALGDPTRLAALEHLASGEHRVRDLVDHLGYAQSTVSRHLSVLAEHGLVARRADGRSSWYSLTDPARLRSLIAAARTLLQAAGARAVPAGH